jgi:hypothetical protein
MKNTYPSALQTSLSRKRMGRLTSDQKGAMEADRLCEDGGVEGKEA